ncbi:MAG: UDP binding domain-containing protein, partial [Flavobacterium sp.]
TINGAEILLLGVTFKENCPDVRNTRIVDVIHALEDYGVQVTTYDPWASPEEVQHEYKLKTTQTLPAKQFDAVVLGVAHKEFLTLNINQLKKSLAVVYDVKGILQDKLVDGRL